MNGKFIKHSFIYMVVGALPLATSILLLPFYGNKYLLTTEQFGLLAIYILLSDFARLAFTFALENYVGVNFIHVVQDPQKQKIFIGTVFGLMTLLGTFMLVLFTTTGNLLFGTIYPGGKLIFFPYGFLSLATGLFTAIFKGYGNLMIYQQKPKSYFWAHFIHFLSVVGISISWLYLQPYSLDGPIYARWIGSIITLLWTFAFVVKNGKFSMDLPIIKDAFKFSIPLWIFYILYWVVANIDRYIILGFLTAKEVAIYDVAIKVTLLIEFLQNGLSSAIFPEVFKIWKANHNAKTSHQEVNKYFDFFTLLTSWSIPLTFLATILFLPLFVNNEDLYQAFRYLPVLLASMIIRSWFYYEYAIINYFKKTLVLAWSFAVVAVFQVILTYWGVRLASLDGAMMVNFLIKILQVVLLYVGIRSWFNFVPSWKTMFFMPSFFIVFLFIAYFFNIPFWINFSIQVIMLLVLMYVFYPHPIRYIKKFVQNFLVF
ncbi:MAG: oligosaccharide flippase family protein [Bacteroidales bacterium]|nr:oligosaccharide flippase family protein [Bacteroidales bacterium]